MDTTGPQTLAQWLATPEKVDSLDVLASRWRDRDVRLLIGPIGPATSAFGAHLRRSFLAALGPSASPAARAGRPCTWQPPCALDVFLREQLRVKGDGLPKPYILFWRQEGQFMEVTLRIFGTACDWAPAAAEALVAAMASLPWTKALHSVPPRVLDRQIYVAPWHGVPLAPLVMKLSTPMDDEGAKSTRRQDFAARVFSRALRRIDALARWQGLALDADCLSQLTAQAHVLTASALHLRQTRHISPNSRKQQRNTAVLLGQIELPPLSGDLALLLSLAQRCHIGRHTNEGLGKIELMNLGQLNGDL